MSPAIVIALILGGGFAVGDAAQKPPKPVFVWRAPEIVEKGGDKTFIVAGTRKGASYVFRARGVCAWQGISLWLGYRYVWRQRTSDIFGIDFRVSFGAEPRRIMNVGARKPETTELTFTADSDDVQVRVWDNWELPDKVSCTVDGIEVTEAPPPAQ